MKAGAEQPGDSPRRFTGPAGWAIPAAAGLYSAVTTFVWFHFFYSATLETGVAISVCGIFFLPYLLLLSGRIHWPSIVGACLIGFLAGLILLVRVNEIEAWSVVLVYWLVFSLPAQFGWIFFVLLLRYFDRRRNR